MAIVVLMAQLAPVYYRADFGPAQAEALFGAFVDDLHEFDIADIEDAVRTYRRDVKNKFFPTPAALRALCIDTVKERRSRAAMPPRRKEDAAITNRPSFWWLLPWWNEAWQDEDIPRDFYPAFLRHVERNGRARTYRTERVQ